jgi:hypothetical protein
MANGKGKLKNQGTVNGNNGNSGKGCRLYIAY